MELAIISRIGLPVLSMQFQAVSLMRREKEPKCGTKVQAIAELSTEPLSNHTLTVTAMRAVICLIL